MPNQYEHFDPAHEFSWTAAPGANGHANGHTNGHAPNGRVPAPTNGRSPNGRSTVTAEPPDPRDLEVATGNVLLFAQRVADDTIADARREAERILAEAHAALPPPAPPEPARPAISAQEVADLRDRSEQLRIESRLRNLLMNDLVECVAELSNRVEREIGEAMQMLEHARERAIADFSAINALARLAGLPTDPQPTDPQPSDAPAEFVPAPDSFVIDLRDALADDRNATTPDAFDELFARRGVYMESRETRRSRWTKSAGLFSTVLGHRAD